MHITAPVTISNKTIQGTTALLPIHMALLNYKINNKSSTSLIYSQWITCGQVDSSVWKYGITQCDIFQMLVEQGTEPA